MLGRSRDRRRARVWPTVGGPTYDIDAQAYFTRSGIADKTVRNAVDGLVVAMKTAGLFAKHDLAHIYANEGSAQAIYNLIKDDHHGTLINMVGSDFAQYQGFTGNGTDKRIQIDFNASTDGVNFGTNSLSVSVYVRNNRAAGENGQMAAFGAALSATGGGVRLGINGGLTVFGAARHQGFANDNGAGDRVASITSRGFYTLSRTGASAKKLYLNGSPIIASTTAAGTLPNSLFNVLAGRYDNGGNGEFSSDQVALFFIGSGLDDIEAAALYAAAEAYMDALGTGVL